MALPALVPVVLALAGGPLTAVVGALRPGAAAPVAVGAAVVAFAACVATWWGGSTPVDLPWAPTWGLRLRFAFDGLATLYALLATGVGAAVTIYATAYVPRHLHHEERPPREAVRFHAFVLLFMGAMVGLVTAGDGVLLFLFWDLTAVTSYFLIGFDREQAEARSAALMALLVTGATSILFLAGAMLLGIATGSFALDAWLAGASGAPPAAMALIAVAALAKSAQVPLHFWLPRAMAAPTPVSAYLHSAAMVAAGVFVLTRLWPLLAAAPALATTLALVGATSMAVGGLLALRADELKAVLAYSTIAHYGYVTLLLGLGGERGPAAASFYVLAHGVAKSALFLAAGAVSEATGETRLSRLGGLGRRMPLLAVATGVAAATLAGLPLTLGYFKEELLFAVALEHGPAAIAAAVGGAAFTVAYTWRFWAGIFLGRARGTARPIEARLIAPVAALAIVALAGGLYPGPAGHLAAAAGGAATGEAPALELAYHLARPETALALLALGLGAALVLLRRPVARVAHALGRAGARAGPERAYQAVLHVLTVSSRRLLAVEQRDLRSRLTPVLAPSAALVAIAHLGTIGFQRLRAGEISADDVPLALTVGIAAVAAVAAARRRRHLAIAVTLSTVGFALAAAYAFFGAPDVALVAVLIETLLTLLFIAILTRFPVELLHGQVRRPPPRGRVWRDVAVSVAAGGLALVVALDALSGPVPGQPVAAQHLQLTPEAHGRDTVTVILADFRGLDTLGEVSVIAIAFAGVLTLLGRRRR